MNTCGFVLGTFSRRLTCCLALLGLTPAFAQEPTPAQSAHASVWVQAAAGNAALHLQSGPGGLFGLLLDLPFPQGDSRLTLRAAAMPDRDTHIFEIRRNFGPARPTELAGTGRLHIDGAVRAEFRHVIDGVAGCLNLHRPGATARERAQFDATPACALDPELASAMVAPPWHD